MSDTDDQTKVTTSSAGDVAAAGDGPPVEERPAAPMVHPTAGPAQVTVEETSGVAAAEASGKLDVDNEAPPGETAGSG